MDNINVINVFQSIIELSKFELNKNDNNKNNNSNKGSLTLKKNASGNNVKKKKGGC